MGAGVCENGRVSSDLQGEERGEQFGFCPKGLHPKGYQDFVAFALSEFGSHVKVPSSLSTHLQATLNCVAFCEFVPELYYFNVAVSV